MNSIAGASEVLLDICALVHLDECIARSPGGGWIERMHFAGTCDSVGSTRARPYRGPVLHDAAHDPRAHTRTDHCPRRPENPPAHFHAAAWLGTQPRRPPHPPRARHRRRRACAITWWRRRGWWGDRWRRVHAGEIEGGEGDDSGAGAEAAINQVKTPGPARAREKDPLVYDLDWDEDDRLEEWRSVLAMIRNLPPVL